MKGRSAGSPEELAAGIYFIEKTGKKRKSRKRSWEFQATKKNDSLVNSTMFGRLVGNKSTTTLIIGAHIDHIGYGDDLSLSHKETGIHNGADDNASGVAALIELHNRLVKKKLPFNILFVAFTAHEIGTFGSEYLSNHLGNDDYICMLNMDMIGRMDPTDLKLYVSENDSLFTSFASSHCKIVPISDKRVMELDTKHFIAQRIPAATFTTGQHNDYHKTSDDEQYIHYKGIAATVLTLEEWILQLAEASKNTPVID